MYTRKQIVDDDENIQVNTIMKVATIKKWVVLGGVATALLVIPRRSSRKADIKRSNSSTTNIANNNNNNDSTLNK